MLSVCYKMEILKTSRTATTHPKFIILESSFSLGLSYPFPPVYPELLFVKWSENPLQDDIVYCILSKTGSLS